MIRWVLTLWSIVLMLPVALVRAASPGASPPAEPGMELTVSLITMGPGPAVYERFAHNAIRIRNTQTGADYAFNYGVFDMGESGFILRFLQGRMMYRLEVWDAPPTIQSYIASGRSVIEQDLNLTPRQRISLWNFLAWNARKEHKEYRYDYYTDNCSTRVRDALDRVLDHEIQRQLTSTLTPHTYRWHTRRIMAYNPVMYTALNFMLGPFVDRPLSSWEESFLPEELAKQVRSLTILNDSGQRVPLLSAERILASSDRFNALSEPPTAWPWYLVCGVAIGGILAAGAWYDPAWKWLRRSVAAFAAIWLFIVGFAGTFLASIWMLTTHVAVYRNENLFHFSPAALPLTILFPAAVLGYVRPRRWAAWLTLFILASSIVGALLKALPAFRQVNGDLTALTLPANLGLAAAMYAIHWRHRVPAVDEAAPSKV